MKAKAIVWLRRDLRIQDHFAFHKAENLQAAIIPIFIFDKEILKNFSNKTDRRISFIFDRLFFLNQQLEKYNLKVQVFYGHPSDIILSLIQEIRPSYLIAGAGYEPYDLARDQLVRNHCSNYNVKVLIENDHLIFPPENIVKDDGNAFKVFTPYSRKSYKKILYDGIDEYSVKNLVGCNLNLSASLNKQTLDLTQKDISLNKMGYIATHYSPWRHDFTRKDMSSFAAKISSYKEQRDFLDTEGTSHFSPYIRFGFISIRDCLRLAMSNENSFTWINELIWRDFYAMILYFYPNAQNEEFIEKYRNLPWRHDKSLFEKFANGLTGFPVIDAAMRQLKAIGWVHNRARMLVASFLTKFLLIDWRWGEKLYAQELMDYEMSSNVGGWQWSASTGFDAQPYFRIFNPILQSKKFDPEGNYIREYVPELSKLSQRYIHDPSKYDQKINYPHPIIDYPSSRKFAISLYKNVEVSKKYSKSYAH